MTHPIPSVLGKDIIWSPEIERLGLQVAEWMTLEQPGAAVFGAHRCGKSAAVNNVAASIHEYYGQPVFATIVDLERGLADRGHALTAEWLNQEGVLSNENTPARLRRRLKEHFIGRMRELETDHILLIVDEAQNLTRNHYGTLISWGNLLSHKGYRVFTLLVGQPELGAAIDSFANMNEMQIVGRYFERTHEFLPIAQADIELVIKGHEQSVALPDGGEAPPTLAGVFPQEWAAGWRPSQWTPVVLEGFREGAVKAGLPADQRVPMQHLRGVLIDMINHARKAGDPYLQFQPDFVVRSLTKLGLMQNWTRYAALMNGRKGR